MYQCPIKVALLCIYGYSNEGENEDGRERREWRLPGFLYADDLVLDGESEEEPRRAILMHFVEVCMRNCLKVNTGMTHQWREEVMCNK